MLGEMWGAQTLVLSASALVVVWCSRSTWLRALNAAIDYASGAYKNRDDNPYLKGNYAPVKNELHSQDLKVIGTLPPSLNGAYIRTGPNPFFDPAGEYHWFDGDGMLHAVRMKDGKVIYCNRWVETSRLSQEKKLGYPHFLKIGDQKGFWGLLHMLVYAIKWLTGLLSTTEGDGTANTAVVFHAKRLLSLHEGDMPYAVRIMCNGLLETLGRTRCGGRFMETCTAHPKVDPITGELVFFSYRVDRKPYCCYRLATASGEVIRDFVITLPKPVMMHDCAITQDYVIFLDNPVIFDLKLLLKGQMPLYYDKERPSRYGVMPRLAEDESAIRWFELPACAIFHTLNAWQEGDLVHLYACCFKEFDLDFRRSREVRTVEHFPKLWHMTFNMATGAANWRRMSPESCEMPQVPPQLVGRKTRYGYAGKFDMISDSPKAALPGFPGILKFNLESTSEATAVAGAIEHGEGRRGGEPFFVPASSNPADMKGEDDGYLMTYVYDNNTNSSEFVVYSAKTMSSEPIARVPLPQRVPFGFHGYHISEAQLQSQFAKV